MFPVSLLVTFPLVAYDHNPTNINLSKKGSDWTPLVRKHTETGHELGREATNTSHSDQTRHVSVPQQYLSSSSSYFCWSLLLFTCWLLYFQLCVGCLHAAERMASDNPDPYPYSLLRGRKHSLSNSKFLGKNSHWPGLVGCAQPCKKLSRRLWCCDWVGLSHVSHCA